jgi:hypothetical protein
VSTVVDMNELGAQNVRRTAVQERVKYSEKKLSPIATFSTKTPTGSVFTH